MINPANLKKSILDYAVRGELSAKFRTEFTNLSAYDEINEFNAKISTLKSQREKLLSNLEKLLKTKPKNSDKIKHIIAKLKTKIKSYRTITPLNTDGDFNPPFEIPNSWAWVKLGDLGEIIRGSGIKKDEVIENGFPCVRYGQLYTTYQTKFTSTISTIPQELFNKCKKVRKNNVLMALTGENNLDIALAVAYLGNDEIAMGGDMVCLSKIKANPLYLVYAINSTFGIKQKSLLATGNIIVHLSAEKLSSIIIPLPPKNEQIYISQVLQNLLKECESYEAKALNLANLQTKFKTQIPKSILDYAVRGELSAKFRLSCHCEERTGGAISSLSSLRESEANEAIQKNSKISKFKDNDNSLDCFDFSTKNLAMTNKTALDEIAEFNAKISTLKSQREKLLSNLEKLLKTKPKNSDKIKHIITKLKTKIKSYRIITPLNTDPIFNPPFEIPNSWAWVKLGEICEIYTGDSINENIKQKEYFGQKFGLNYIGTKDVNFDNSINYENGVKIPQNSLFKFKIAKENSVLMCIEGGSAGRKIAILNQNVCFGNKLCCFFSKFIENKTIFYYLQSAEFFKTFSSNLNGIIGGVNIKKLNEILIPLPPKNEQEFIASELEKLLSLCKNL